MPRYYIGQYPFVSMSQFPISEKTTVEIESRPGVDGLYFWDTGKRGRPFQVQTFADVNNVESAGYLMTLYEQEIGKVVPVVFAGLFLPNQYMVLDVEPLAEGIRQVAAGVGGLSYPSTSAGIIQAVWTLAAAPVQLQQPDQG